MCYILDKRSHVKICVRHYQHINILMERLSPQLQLISDRSCKIIFAIILRCFLPFLTTLTSTEFFKKTQQKEVNEKINRMLIFPKY